MKFTDGQWMLQQGVSAFYPAEVNEAVQEGDTVLIHAPTRNIRHRGDTLGGPILTIRISSPMADVIQVKAEHFQGGKDLGPAIPVKTTGDAKKITITDEIVELSSGSASIRINRKWWEMAFIGRDAAGAEKVLTKSAGRGLGYIERRTLTTGAPETFLHDQLSLGVGENVYGLGEHFTAFVKNGQVVETWNRDGGTSCDQGYKCVPFYLTNRGYGVLVLDHGPVNFEVASEKVAKVQFSIPGEKLEYLVIHGPSPKAILAKLTALTGRPALPPAWTFGLWLTSSFTTSYDEATCTSFIEGMAKRDLPLSVFHFDCFWMKEYNWCDFQWDPKVFPDPKGMLQRFHERGLKVCVWINSYIGQRSPAFAELKAKGYLLKKPNGDVWQTDQWQPGMGIVDFTNPGARQWFGDHLRRLMAMGVDCFKTDFGERIPTEVAWFDGSDPQKMHNAYAVLYNETVFKVVEEVRGKGEAALFARSAATGGQQFPIHWGGDCWSTLESMAESLRGGLSLTASGFGFWSHDIGGFEGLPPAHVYKRWLAFGLMSTHSRLHGSSSYRVPWNYDDAAVDVCRFWTKTKIKLMPYLWAQAVKTHQTGVPMMRAMVIEFAGDPACDTLDRQYMLGDDLLVAPVFTDDGSCDFYLPEGTWTSYLTGEVRTGGRWQRSVHDFDSLPLYVRQNTILAIGSRDDRPDYDFTDGTTFQVYALADGATATTSVPALDGSKGLTVTAVRKGSTITVTLDGTAKTAWSVQLVGTAKATASAGTVSADPKGVVVKVAPGVRSVILTVG